MKKNLIAIGVLVLLVSLAAGYRMWLAPQNVRDVTITIPLRSWSFEPSNIDVNVGETLRVTIVNNDDIEHGFAIDAYRINVSVPSGATVTSPTFVVDRDGTFNFYCSVVCGEGVVEHGAHKGETKGHFKMGGTLTVGSTTPR